jgi:hypothetical protein
MAKPTVPPEHLAVRIAALEAKNAALEAKLARLKEKDERERATSKERLRDKLSDAKIKRLTRPGFYSDGRNLYLDFRTPPGKAWVLRYTRDHVTRDCGLGPYPTVTLQMARDARDDALRELVAGVDPIDAKRAARAAKQHERIAAMTFAEAAEERLALEAARPAVGEQRSPLRPTDHRRLAGCGGRPPVRPAGAGARDRAARWHEGAVLGRQRRDGEQDAQSH